MSDAIQAIANAKIGFIGAGNMAASILGGLIQSGLPAKQIYVSNPSQGKLDALLERYPDLNTSNDNAYVAENVDYLLLSVKPQKMGLACKPLQALDLNCCVISVAAGVACQTIEELLGKSLAVIRSMPNTPSLIGAGATGLFANQHTSEQQKAAATAIFDAVGLSVWVNDESQMDLVTAVSGSGPAHYFLYMESVVSAAIEQGLPEATARQLAAQTALGAARMVQDNAELEISQLRRNVTSPGGTTAAALDVLNDGGLPELIAKAIKASVVRGKELAEIASKPDNN
ncbi:pyrroline-5-carboxylate reductase [Kangiella aquimarina]|uniref:Pyrroline-5-carboxylate reductase n=1 Tax=Kangiella aquimarina TaxID=261965 RepID=A0ABZ0X4L3_9GAMM|nr:pyrroline-5-carboxylate reductase [Kangiella aquimarina]WQG85470.1 pyrroline-5-carboxylate reductase [Kangiella aquimarina]